jgi:histidinol-phosphatase
VTGGGLAPELELALELADAAAAISVAAFGPRHRVSHKDDGTPVTEVDARVEDLLRDRIHARFPTDAVLGEERGLTGPPGATRRWAIDPLDGTKQYADGVPLWSTLLGLASGGRPVLGVIDAPMTRERFWAVSGEGATRNGSTIRVSDVATLADAAVGHSGLEEWTHGADRARLLRVADAARRTRGLSDAWGQMQVAAGAIDACLEHEPCGPWDWTATVVIVQEAGGRVSALTGAPVGDGTDLLVTNGMIHDEVLELLNARDGLEP